MISKYLIRCCQRKTIKFDRKLKSFLSDDMIQRLQTFEENCFYKYSYDLDLLHKERLEENLSQAAIKIESINSRIDDIFFKENITKSSLYKMELRLQKLEDIAFESMSQLSSLNKLFGNNSNSNDNWRNIIKQKVLRHRSVTISGAECLNLNEGGLAPVPAPSLSIVDKNNDELLSDIDSLNEKLQSSQLLNEPINDLANEVLLQQQQQLSGLDQYTIHPFVYLHSVVKPPLAEYTSITDCIDTSTIDRPASPQMHHSVGNHQVTSNYLNFVPKNSTSGGKKSNVKDYCAIETTRSAVARQESEILRLAEESQHVIINQMLNKLVKQSSIDETEIEDTNNNTNNDDELNIDGNNLDQFQTENETSFIIQSNYSSQKSMKKSNGTGLNVPLSHDARNYSQIFYAQTQAGALVSHVEEEEEEQIRNDN